MNKELAKAYDPKQYEDAIYARWEESGFFNPNNLTGDPYAIMMPPPNVTGVLHLGHALENTLMDLMARFQRMQGKKVLLLPGTDHAAVATQAKVEKLLVEKGVTHPREELGREGLLKEIKEYAEKSKTTILSQIRKMGTSCDWSRLAYTFDEARNRAVNEMFVRMYNDGLVYRGHRVVNWSVQGQSTCSDDELVYVERPGKLYTFRYSKDFPITIASTRPETKLGDTAVAVHPTDERYARFIGQTFTVDVGAAKPLEIRIIADAGVDKDFGTGALGVTPAHSAIDFEMYEKQKANGTPIGLVQVIGADGRMTAAAGAKYTGKTAEEARGLFADYLRENGLMEKEEDIVQNVGTSDRFKDVVEALPMTQWFVAVNKEIQGRGKTLKDLMKEAVATGHKGDSKQKVSITPDRFEKVYYHWIDHLRDWCISRQIWWGHRIPVWYRGEEIFVGMNPPEGAGWEQDPDTLDTWFSSGTWTFSTLGWPIESKDIQTYHPTHWMQMGHEIIFFWMARMILMSTYALDQIPFKDVYIHGLLRNEQGKKFSKSDGSTADPLDMIAAYGTDALRYSIVAGITPGNDSRFYKEKIEGARNLVNKLWNMSRFILMNIKNPQREDIYPEPKTFVDKSILIRLTFIIHEVSKDIEEYRFSSASEKLRDFTWNDLADWYLEIAKVEADKSEILNYILNTILKLWHPFMPFVTEAVWQEVYGEKYMLMVEKWPSLKQLSSSGMVTDWSRLDILPVEQFRLLRKIVTSIRSIRSDYHIEQSVLVDGHIFTANLQPLIQDNLAWMTRLARLGQVMVGEKNDGHAGMFGFTEGGVEVYLDLAKVMDIPKERARIEKEIATVAPYVQSLEKKLGNEQFAAHAPEAVVDAERKKLADSKAKLTKLQQQLSQLQPASSADK